jgi:serine/threonine protein kinase
MNDETLPHDPGDPILRQDTVRLPAEARPGGTILGQYKLVRKIAAGGMGEVYEAVQLNLDRRVALKLVAEHFSSDPIFLQRFEREAKAAALLNHPNVVQVYDFGCIQNQYYLAMEYVDGKDLAELVHSSGKLDLPLALSVIEQTAQALAAALEKKIIHRDIKPSNLLLSAANVLKVSDLGLAKRLDEASDMTLSGSGMGSPHFLAPEQASDARTVDHRADIYALGITLLYLLTGKRPFDRTSAFSVVLAHAQNPLPTGEELGTQLSPPVEALIRKMAAKNPQDRYQTYAELLQDVARVRQGLQPKSPLRTASSPNWQLIGIAAAIALLVALIGLVISQRTKAIPDKNLQQADARTDRPTRFRPGDADERLERRGPPPDRGGPEGDGASPEGPRFRLPMPRPDPPERNAIPEGPIPVMLAAAREYARTNKSAYRPIVDRYSQVEERAQGTEFEGEVHTLVEEARTALQTAASAAVTQYRDRMNQLLKQNRPGLAFDVWRTFPGSLRTWEIDRQIEAELTAALPRDFHPAR